MPDQQLTPEEIVEAVKNGAKIQFPMPQSEQPHPVYGFGEPLPDAEESAPAPAPTPESVLVVSDPAQDEPVEVAVVPRPVDPAPPALFRRKK